jgi:hypothetical protein
MIETLALVLGGLLAVACVVFVARPFLAEPAPTEDALPEASPAADETVRLREERDRSLAALKELEFDHRTGKITDEDYRALVQPLRRQAARTLGNGAPLSTQTAEPAPEQRFSEQSLPSSRPDR